MIASRRTIRSDHPTAEPTGPSRRTFVKLSGAALAALAAPGAAAAERPVLDADRAGVLVDLTLCIGCRRCEWACSEANGLPNGPLGDCDDASVFAERRRPDVHRLTVVNRESRGEGRRPVHLPVLGDGAPGRRNGRADATFVKTQCMHCEDPPCVSACLVGAMRKDPDGPVTWDPGRCIGCRYCLVACPFQNLAYEYDDALTPRVRKCTLCRERTRRGGVPACVEICPVEALQHGPRDELLAVAYERIRRHPDRYVDHVYGEHEGGGTSWLYLSDRPFAELGFPTLGPESRAARSERIQHGIFRGFAAPVLVAGFLAALHVIARRGGET